PLPLAVAGLPTQLLPLPLPCPSRITSFPTQHDVLLEFAFDLSSSHQVRPASTSSPLQSCWLHLRLAPQAVTPVASHRTQPPPTSRNTSTPISPLPLLAHRLS